MPLEWYKDQGHVGYSLDGKKLVKPASKDEVSLFFSRFFPLLNACNNCAQCSAGFLPQSHIIFSLLFSFVHCVCDGDHRHQIRLSFFSFYVMSTVFSLLVAQVSNTHVIV